MCMGMWQKKSCIWKPILLGLAAKWSISQNIGCRIFLFKRKSDSVEDRYTDKRAWTLVQVTAQWPEQVDGDINTMWMTYKWKMVGYLEIRQFLEIAGRGSFWDEAVVCEDDWILDAARKCKKSKVSGRFNNKLQISYDPKLRISITRASERQTKVAYSPSCSFHLMNACEVILK